MTLEAETLIQLLGGLFLGIIGYLVRDTLAEVKELKRMSHRNASRLIRIETRLGIEPGDDIA